MLFGLLGHGDVPQAARADAFGLIAPILRGGFGTITGALDAGLPMVVIPLGADQLLNAACCAALGVGTCWARASGRPRRSAQLWTLAASGSC
jgi:UDP:flavonoid glycosyltransferase YjiC (YdhE family)